MIEMYEEFNNYMEVVYSKFDLFLHLAASSVKFSRSQENVFENNDQTTAAAIFIATSYYLVRAGKSPQ